MVSKQSIVRVKIEGILRNFRGLRNSFQRGLRNSFQGLQGKFGGIGAILRYTPGSLGITQDDQLGTLGLLFGLPIDSCKGILKVNSEVLMGLIGSKMKALWGTSGLWRSTLGYLSKYFGITLRVFQGFYGFHKIVEMFFGDLIFFSNISLAPYIFEVVI